MNLLEIRTRLVSEQYSGRNDLVVDTTDYVDNGANSFIQAGQRFLDTIMPHRKSVGRYVKDVSTNQMKLVMRYVRSIDSVFVKEAGEDRGELDRKSLSWLQSEYGSDFGAKTLGKGTLTVVPVAEEVLTINADTYTFKAAAASTVQITIGSTVTASIANIVAAINVHSSVVKAYQVSATEFTVEALLVGTDANSYVFTTDVTGASLDGSGTLGGARTGRITGVTTGAPLYYSSLQSLPSPELTINNMGSLDTLELLFGYSRFQMDGILFMPPADGSYTLSVFADFFSLMANDYDVSYHSEMYPELLIMASSMAIEIIYRNTQGVNDWLNAMQPWLQGINFDLVDEEVILSGSQMNG